MGVYKSKVDTESAAFQDNRTAMLGLIDELRQLESRAESASNRRAATFAARGQIPPRERVARLLDPGAPFLRLHSLTNYLRGDPNPETSVPGGSVILGIGFIHGVRCMIWADDSGIRAGAATRGGWASAINIQEMAIRLKLPLVHLVESAGLNLREYEVEAWADAGKLFRNLARSSAAGIPTMVVLHGPSTAGGAYMPGMSDYVIGIKNNGLAALGGAALVQAATGEVADERDLGGTEMHAAVTGSVEYLAEDDAHGIAIAREVVEHLNWNARLTPPARRSYQPPIYDADEIAGIVPVDYTVPYDVREVIARVVDGQRNRQYVSGINTGIRRHGLGD